MTDIETLKLLNSRNFERIYHGTDIISDSIIRKKIQEIPNEFFEPKINVDNDGTTKISLIQFSMQTAGMNSEKKNGLMQKYNINPYDMKKLQTIIDSIKVAQEYGKAEKERIENRKENYHQEYGFSLASNDRLDKAYPLWLAYLFADSVNPLMDIKAKLKEDGMEEKYEPETILELIEYNNMLMKGKDSEEKKDFYIKSISDILERATISLTSEIEI